tara:strand:+ start:92 stop:850 length:759 start_codon:yes stop_codon:yes gene_type:complete
MFFSNIFNSFIYQPLYNALIALAGIVPGADLGVAVILLTIIVKVILLPLAHKSVKTQAAVRNLDGDIKQIREKYKDQQEQARKVMDLYKQHGVNPFSGCIFTLVQIPIIFGLYWVFWRGLRDGLIDPSLLYSFVQNVEGISFDFLGIVSLVDRSIVFAVLAGISQFFQMRLALPPIKEDKKSSKNLTFSGELKKNMTTQAKYVLPAIIGFVSLGFPSAVPLYWTTSNIFSIGHELIVRRKAKELLQADKPQA